MSSCEQKSHFPFPRLALTALAASGLFLASCSPSIPSESKPLVPISSFGDSRALYETRLPIEAPPNPAQQAFLDLLYMQAQTYRNLGTKDSYINPTRATVTHDGLVDIRVTDSPGAKAPVPDLRLLVKLTDGTDAKVFANQLNRLTAKELVFATENAPSFSGESPYNLSPKVTSAVMVHQVDPSTQSLQTEVYAGEYARLMNDMYNVSQLSSVKTSWAAVPEPTNLIPEGQIAAASQTAPLMVFVRVPPGVNLSRVGNLTSARDLAETTLFMSRQITIRHADRAFLFDSYSPGELIFQPTTLTSKASDFVVIGGKIVPMRPDFTRIYLRPTALNAMRNGADQVIFAVMDDAGVNNALGIAYNYAGNIKRDLLLRKISEKLVDAGYLARGATLAGFAVQIVQAAAGPIGIARLTGETLDEASLTYLHQMIDPLACQVDKEKVEGHAFVWPVEEIDALRDEGNVKYGYFLVRFDKTTLCDCLQFGLLYTRSGNDYSFNFRGKLVKAVLVDKEGNNEKPAVNLLRDENNPNLKTFTVPELIVTNQKLRFVFADATYTDVWLAPTPENVPVIRKSGGNTEYLPVGHPALIIQMGKYQEKSELDSLMMTLTK